MPAVRVPSPQSIVAVALDSSFVNVSSTGEIGTPAVALTFGRAGAGSARTMSSPATEPDCARA